MAGPDGVPVGTAAGLPGHGRWSGPDDYLAVMEETPEQTERRRSAWPCTRLGELLSPELRHIGPG